jgi:cystathionine beta-lyase
VWRFSASHFYGGEAMSAARNYNFDEMVERRGTACEKWDGMKEVFGRDDLLPFWVADMDFKSAPEIIEALKRRTEFGVFGYPVMREEAYQSVADWEKRRHGWDVSADQVGFVPGVVTGLIAAIEEFTEPGDGVVIQPPIYPPFARSVKNNSRKLVENPLRETPSGYVMDFDHLKKILTPDVKAIALCSPHNPVARVWRREELAELGRICLERGIIVINDEIHQDLIFSDAKHVPLSVACPELDPNLVTLAAPSKTFNIAGLAASAWIARDKKIADRMRNVMRRFHLSEINLMGIAALETAYAEGEPWLEAVMAYLERNRDLVENFLRERLPRVSLKHPEGTYIFWLDFRDYGLKHSELMDILVNRAKVALNSGVTFGSQGEGFARLNIGCPKARLEEGLERIASAFAGM